MQAVVSEKFEEPLTVRDVDRHEPTGRIVAIGSTIVDTSGGDRL